MMDIWLKKLCEELNGEFDEGIVTVCYVENGRFERDHIDGSFSVVVTGKKKLGLRWVQPLYVEIEGGAGGKVEKPDKKTANVKISSFNTRLNIELKKKASGYEINSIRVETPKSVLEADIEKLKTI